MRWLAILVIVLLLGTPALAETVDVEEEREETKPPVVKEVGAVTEIPWGEMDDRQIALYIINRQIDYLLGQVEGNDQRFQQLEKSSGERVTAEREAGREALTEVREELAQREDEVAQLREENRHLERQMAHFTSENAVYLKMLISLLVGVILGLVLAGILRWWKYRQPQSQHMRS